jgi:hypothetical protein
MATVVDVLDGTAPIDFDALADLARERAILGARWLANVVQADGAYHYIYRPREDEYDSTDYSDVRHAAVTYALYQIYDVCRDPEILAAAERATRYIANASIPTSPGAATRAFAQEGRTWLGGQALALVALLERRRVLGDTGYDDLIDALATFLLTLESPNEPGEFAMSWSELTGDLEFNPHVLYFPGEALLALTRLAVQFPDGPYLSAAIRSANFLIRVRDGDLTQADSRPREDHWLAMALPELFRLHSDPGYITFSYAQASSMIANQRKSDVDDPGTIGASGHHGPIGHTSIATKGEALAGVWSLAAHIGHTAALDQIREATGRNAQYRMRNQFTEENTRDFPRPDRAIGAWGASRHDPTVRNDYIQHNISALIALWHLVISGDLATTRRSVTQTTNSR